MRLARHVTTLLVAAVCQLACLGGADLEIDVASDEPLIVAEGDDECTVCRANAAAPGCGGTSDPNLIVCDGPWRFQQFKSCPRVHPECGCARWNQVRDRQCGATTRDRTQHATVVGQRVEQTCLNGPPGPGCEEPGPSVFFPNRAAARDACRALHDDWVAQDEQTFDTHPSLDFRWESVGSSVPSSPIQPGPSNGTGYTWQCSSTRNFSTANICTADKCEATGACGECQEVASCYRYDSDCGIDSIQYAHMGTSRSELVEAQCAAADQSSACESSFLSRECTTADDILDPNAKVEALDENLNLGFPLAAREIDPDIYRKVYQRVQLTYEFFGLDLSEANRRRARHVYSIDGWPEALDCGNSPSPAALGRCPETDPLLVFCARMTSDHVNPDFVWRGKHGDGHPGIGNFCYRLLESYDSEQCANNVTINEAWEVQQALLDKMGDQFEAHFATDVCVVDAPEEKRDLRTAASSLYLWHITDWYYANLPFSSTERADDELMRAMGDFWRHVDGAMELNKAIEDGLVCGEDDDGVGAITASFDRAIERAFEANQDILRAAMIQYNGAPPDVIRGMPLVAVFGQISQSFIDRLEAQRATHDLGCRFGGCRSVAANGDISVTQTRISYLYQLLAMIDDVPGLSGALAQPSIDSDWIPAFQVVSENHSKLISALQEILGTDTLETADVSALRRPGQALISGLNRAKSRHNAYSETGELVVGTGRYQQAPLDQARRDGVIAVLQTAVDGLNTELDQFDVAVGRLITQLVDEAQSGAAVERLRERRLQLAKEIDRVDAKRNAHARAAVGENAADQVARALVEAEGRLEAEGQVNSYLTVERRGPIYLAGNDALWSGDGRPNLIGDITGGSEVVSAGRGELITVNVTAGSRWSPSCALSDLGLNAPSTGPSGYTVVDNDGVFEASSTTEAAEDSWGVSVSACVGGGFVLSAQVCVNRAFQKSRTKTETQGSERRTSAQFESGFYDGSTPLHAPVGSLLLVEMPEGVYDLDEIRDVHLIREPSTTIVPSAADGGVPRSEFYFVVNDNVSSCPGGEPNSDQALEVHVARLQFGDRSQKKQTPDFQGLLNPSQHKEDVSNSGPKGSAVGQSSESSWLLYGAAFKARIRSLAQNGLTETGERHDAVLKLAWHLGVVEGLGRQESLDQIREWLELHHHVSATRGRGDRVFLRETLREVANYIDTRVSKVERWRRRAAPRLLGKALSASDVNLIERCVQAPVRGAVTAILRHIKAYANEGGRVRKPLELSSKLLWELCGDKRIVVANEDGTKSRRRTSVVALEELSRLGLLAIHTNYSVGHHGRRYTCWYEFGSGVAPRETESGDRELARRDVEEGELILELPLDSEVPVARIQLREDSNGDVVANDSRNERGRLPWWERMYDRRALVPGDFFGAIEAEPGLGPFRHRFSSKSLQQIRLSRSQLAPSNSNEQPVMQPQEELFELAKTIDDRGLRDAIAKAWAAFDDSS